MKISVIRKSLPIEIELADGNVVMFSVKEMTGAQRDDYFNRMSGKTKIDPNTNEVVGVKDYSGLYSTLLSLTLYDPDDKLVPEAKIQEWPDSAQRAVWEVAKDLNGLSKEGAEKN